MTSKLLSNLLYFCTINSEDVCQLEKSRTKDFCGTTGTLFLDFGWLSPRVLKPGSPV